LPAKKFSRGRRNSPIRRQYRGGRGTVPPGEPHREGAGDEGGVVFYSVRGKEGTLFEFLDDDLHVVGTLSMQDYINVFKAQKNA
jgi:hypothetical protein